MSIEKGSALKNYPMIYLSNLIFLLDFFCSDISPLLYYSVNKVCLEDD